MINRPARIEGALLAGACAGVARTFNWNVWVLRALFVAFLLVKTIRKKTVLCMVYIDH